jgi:hypothetical protein
LKNLIPDPEIRASSAIHVTLHFDGPAALKPSLSLMILHPLEQSNSFDVSLIQRSDCVLLSQTINISRRLTESSIVKLSLAAVASDALFMSWSSDASAFDGSRVWTTLFSTRQN